VAEDVTDIILNLKDIVLTSAPEPVVIRLDIAPGRRRRRHQAPPESRS
jgi:DNA-directed RNA polymerase alpha subunit